MERPGSPGELIDLTGTVVAATGASGGIGAGIARRFAATGASLVIHHRDGHATAEMLVEELPVPTALVAADITEPGGADAIVSRALTVFGRLDAVVNCVGVQPVGDLESISEGEWRQVVDVNLTGSHLVTQAAARAMIPAGRGGSIVHIASIEGSRPAPRHGHYAASKAGVIMYARAAALEYGPAGIRVNSVSPGLIDRPDLSESWPEGVRRWTAAAPLGRLGTPEDIGDACVFLVSPMSRWITGHDLVVDGGVSVHPTW